jgi:tetrahydromethanopterin S-methyltransferase subunit A
MNDDRSNLSDHPNDPTERPGPDTAPSPPAIVGDVVFGGMDSPVAVCTLASRSLLPELAGRPEIAVAGRVFTENVGIERMVQNLAAFGSIRYLIVCGRETPHNVGQTILALHRAGLDPAGRVIGSEAPDPRMPNLTADQLRAFRTGIRVVDMIGESDVTAIVERARTLGAEPVPDDDAPTTPTAPTAPIEAGDPTGSDVERVKAVRSPNDAWSFDPVGYFLVFVDRPSSILRVEQYSSSHRLVRIVEGTSAEAICHTIDRLGQVTLLAHAAYLGRELAKAETALRLGLDYDQDRPLSQGEAGSPRPSTAQRDHAGGAS